MRYLLSILLCLLIATPASADALEAAALGQALPLILGILAISLAIVTFGFFASIKDFRSPRVYPSRSVVVTISIAFLCGLLLSSASQGSGEKFLKPFPNIFTELYIPIAILLVFLKQIKTGRSFSLNTIWVSGIAACLFVSSSALTHYFVPIEGLVAIIIWFVFFLRLKKSDSYAAADTRAKLWIAPLIASIYFVFYQTFLYVITNILYSTKNSDAAYFMYGQLSRLAGYSISGFLIMAMVFGVSSTPTATDSK